MDNVIDEYQKWKLQGESLRAKARHAMESRFKELLTEAVQIATEYRNDFSTPLKPPAVVTSFKYKSGAPAKKAPAPVAAAPKPPDKKVLALRKKLAEAKKKLDAAKAAGSATKNLEDKIYEMEDDLRLATAD